MSKKGQVSKFQIWVTALGFLGLLFVPSAAWIFCHDAIGDDMSENRKLAEMPEFKIGKISAFPKGFENFWNDHLPFRRSIRTLWSEINFFGLGDSPTTQVVLGKYDGDSKNRWLFYSRETDYNPVRDAQGITTYKNTTREEVLNVLRRNTKYFKDKNIDFYLFVAPNKENIYKEYFPDSITIYNEKSRGDELLEFLVETSGEDNVIYAKDEIVQAKVVGQLYYKDDTHWNGLGGFYGFKSLMNKIDPAFKDFSYEIEWSQPKPGNRDMSVITNILDYHVDSWPEITYNPTSTFEKYGSNGIAEMNNKDAKIEKTIMIVGDSYRNAMMPYLAKTFSKVIGLHRDGYKSEFLDRYKPDIVVSEAVERYLLPGSALSLIGGR